MVGYARVSTEGQNLDLQIEALKAHGVTRDRIYTDVMSGARTDRPGLKDAIKALREGDALVIWKLDRLGRSVRGILDTVETIKSKGVELVVLTESIDTRTPMGKFVFHILAALAQMERDLTIERTKAGLKTARERGVAVGRQETMTTEKAAKARAMLWPSDGSQPATKEAVSKALGVSRSKIYMWIRAEEARERAAADPLDDH